MTKLILFCAWLVAIIFYARWRIRKGWNDDPKDYDDWYMPSGEDVAEHHRQRLDDDNAILDWWKEQNSKKSEKL